MPPTFSTRPLNEAKFFKLMKRQPFLLFGLPFVVCIVGGSFGLSVLTRARYDLDQQQKSTVTKEEELKLQKNRKRFNLQEVYWDLQTTEPSLRSNEYEIVRVPRPAGAFDGVLEK